MSEDYPTIIEELIASNPMVQKIALLSPQGDLLHVSGDWDPSADGKALMETWLARGPRVEIQGTGFSVLRSEPEQFIAKNVAGKGNLAGSITKGGNYLVAFISPEALKVGEDYFDVARAAGKMK